MFKNRFVAIVGAAIIIPFAAVPAGAADDIEAKAQTCATCHGANGEPTDPKTVPVIWGQRQDYQVKQLHDYRSGDRDNPIMSPIAKGLAQDELRKLAAYFAAKTWPVQHTGAAGPPPAAIAGKIAMCRACHQPNFEGGAPGPRLAGLSYEYLAASMRGFAQDERSNNGDMPKFMQALTDSERDAIAHYLSTL